MDAERNGMTRPEEVSKLEEECLCTPCENPMYGHPSFAHCAACCYGSLIEDYNHDCPVGEHREMAEMQHPKHLLIEDAK